MTARSRLLDLPFSYIFISHLEYLPRSYYWYVYCCDLKVNQTLKEVKECHNPEGVYVTTWGAHLRDIG